MNLKTLVIFLVGVIIAKVFLSWLIIIPVLVVSLIAWGYKAMAATNQIGPKWAKRLTIIGVTLLVIFYGMMFASHKWPWLTNAINNQQTILTYRATDLIEPKYPGGLSKSIYETRMLLIQSEEERQEKILSGLREKIIKKEPLTVADRQLIETAKVSLDSLKTQLADIHMIKDPAEKKSSFDFPKLSSIGFNQNTLAIIAGIALILGLALIFFKKGSGVEKGPGVGKKLLWIAGIVIVVSVVWQIAGHKSTPAGDQTSVQQSMAQTAWPGQIDWSKAQKYEPIEVPAGETVDTGISYGPGDYVKFTQLTDSDFWTLGDHKTLVSEQIRILRGLPPNGGTINLKGGNKSARIIIEIIRKT